MLAALGSDAAHGLPPEEAAERLRHDGPNALPEPPRRSIASIFLGQLKSPLVYLLFLAAAVVFALGETTDALVILSVVLLNAVIGALQEGRAERSLEALRKLAGHKARLVRGGQELVLFAREVVRGDVVLLGAGDAVPADARVVEAAGLEVAEAALTGESLPVAKGAAAVPGETPLADRTSMVHAGTHVTAGRGRAVVVATGGATEVGQIAALTSTAREPETPLSRRIATFGRALLVAAAALFVTVMGLGWLQRLELGELLMIAISQVVGLVPEGLPVVMTVALAVGVQRMAKRGAIVRRLAAVETLGSTTVICSDKTGTLTKNEMTVVEVHLPGAPPVQVTGVGYAPEGGLSRDGAPVDTAADPRLLALAEAAVLCNDADVVRGDDGRLAALGDPTEAALVTFGRKAGLDPAALRASRPRRGELPFEAATKLMATVHDHLVAVKGAPEVLAGLARAEHGPDGERPLDLADLRGRVEAMASRALRVLALGAADLPEGVDPTTETLRGRVVLLGLVGQVDPPREEAAASVRACKAAGIRPVMITGDHKATALAVARQLGIASEGDVALDGTELSDLDDAALAKALAHAPVFARVHPSQKLRLVTALQAQGHVVAMTGDGVNDAPALARADVGVAMGITGTEVAKEAAKVVLTDDNFATLVRAVEEGRLVYANLKKALLLLLSTSFAEVGVLVLALVAGFPPPFAAVQILWNNVVTEGTITVNLAMEPLEGDELRRPPVPRDDPLLGRALLGRLVLFSVTIAAVTLGWFSVRLSQGVAFEVARTETFTLLAVCEWFNVLNCRSAVRSALDRKILLNRWLLAGLVAGNVGQAVVVFVPAMNEIFYTTPIGFWQVLQIGAVGSLVLWVEELRKWIVRRRVAAAPVPA